MLLDLIKPTIPQRQSKEFEVKIKIKLFLFTLEVKLVP
tara:strand:+ start:1091 stop:1204 length:114 start_codon:yes stop_codon:yes gene_type:complete